MPELGEFIDLDGYRLSVEAIDGYKITRIRLATPKDGRGGRGLTRRTRPCDYRAAIYPARRRRRRPGR
ncbi:transporter associated domain-containing protein [Sphingobium sp.]|uniref:transporter associated domain-containing protein n=1 Tax=Sphingobium TaxID=165695 RepID=UPI001A200726|nr:transporter associated domain-containing protein [Sphingobium sp.]MBJ7376966.1 hypothetical protein [Sphingobium sp.]